MASFKAQLRAQTLADLQLRLARAQARTIRAQIRAHFAQGELQDAPLIDPEPTDTELSRVWEDARGQAERHARDARTVDERRAAESIVDDPEWDALAASIRGEPPPAEPRESRLDRLVRLGQVSRAVAQVWQAAKEAREARLPPLRKNGHL